MAHLRLEWVLDRFGDVDVVVVDVRVGLHRASIRDVGRLELHASELNAVDRMLRVGASFEHPAHSYEIVEAVGGLRPRDEPPQPLRGHSAQRMASALAGLDR